MISGRATTPLFTVVVPTYNRANSILATLLSVKGQTFSAFECVVVDDGSDDVEHLAAVIESLRDSRFRLVRRANGGGGAARNAGVEVAQGAFIAFLDSDDLFLPGKLDAVANAVRLDQRVVWYSQALVDRGGTRMWRRPSRPIASEENVGEYLFVANEVIQTSTIVLARDAALEVKFDPTLRKGQDLDLCLRLCEAGYRFRMLADPLAIWVDRTEEGRTSRVSGYEAPMAWLERSRCRMTRRAELGYRANVLAYYMAKERPWLALMDIFRGWAIARVPTRMAIRQAARCFVPRRVYRQLVDFFVRCFGSREAGTAPK